MGIILSINFYFIPCRLTGVGGESYMAVAPKDVDINLVRRLVPFDTLSLPKIEEVLAKSALQKIPAGKILFKEGDRDKWTVYLLEGEIELANAHGQKQLLKAGEKDALKPLAKGVPRTLTATSKSTVVVLIIDTELLSVLINWNTSESIEVSDFSETDEDDDDWMTRFLQSNAFIRLPPSNMQALLIKLEEVSLSKGKIVIKEGDSSDQNYYIIKQGQCIVSRLDPTSNKQRPLAILDSGVGFGEEALITGMERGATVSMKTDGVVMKLAKDDFIELLVKPLIHLISKKQIEALGEDNLLFVDVRSPLEYQDNALEGSINLPIRTIRTKIPQLDPNIHYIVYSNAENRSSSAAFLFIQQGLEVSVLRDGIGKTRFSEEEIRQSMLQAEFSSTGKKIPIAEQKPVLADSTTATGSEQNIDVTGTSNQTEKTHDIVYYQQKLAQAEAIATQAQARVAQLQQEIESLRAPAEKDAKLARNAVLLLKKSEQKIKALEAEIQKRK